MLSSLSPCAAATRPRFSQSSQAAVQDETRAALASVCIVQHVDRIYQVLDRALASIPADIPLDTSRGFDGDGLRPRRTPWGLGPEWSGMSWHEHALPTPFQWCTP